VVAACVLSGSNAGALCMCEQTRRRLGMHAVAAIICRERLGPGIAAASGSAAASHARSGSTIGGQGEEATGVLHLVGLG
jgi:hypothetical protein